MNKLKDNISTIILVIIIILQSLICIYSASKREDYHIDEYYSHGLIQYDKDFIMDNESFYNNWHDVEYFKDYLTIKDQNKYDFSPVYKNQIEDVHPPLYYLLLRISCSFNIDNFSKWPGTILNIIIAAIATIILYLIGIKLFDNKYFALLTCFVNAMCIGIVQTVIFIRMYELFTLNVLLLVYWHIINKDKEKLNTKDLILLSILVVSGFLTHYYYAIVVAILYFMYIIKFCKKKMKKEAIKYTLAIFIAVILALTIFPYALVHIFLGYRGKEAVKNVVAIKSYLEGIKEYIKIVNIQILNKTGIMILIVIVALAIINIIRKVVQKAELKNKINNNFWYIIGLILIYFAIISICASYKDLRYIMPIIPLMVISVIYLIKFLFSNLENEKRVIIYTTILCILYCITNISKFGDNIYTYKGTTTQVEKIVEAIGNRPFFVSSAKVGSANSKFMETYVVVTKMPETCVIDTFSINKELIEKLLQGKDTSNGIAVMARYEDGEIMKEKMQETGMFKEVNLLEVLLPYYCIFELK